MQKQPTASSYKIEGDRMSFKGIGRSVVRSSHLWCGLEYTLGNPSLTTDSNSVILVDFFHKLVLRHSFGGVIYMPALVSESLDSIRADVFEEEELKVLILHWVKNFWLTDVRLCAAAPSTNSIVESGG